MDPAADQADHPEQVEKPYDPAGRCAEGVNLLVARQVADKRAKDDGDDEDDQAVPRPDHIGVERNGERSQNKTKHGEFLLQTRFINRMGRVSNKHIRLMLYIEYTPTQKPTFRWILTLVRAAGFEPATVWLRANCSTN